MQSRLRFGVLCLAYGSAALFRCGDNTGLDDPDSGIGTDVAPDGGPDAGLVEVPDPNRPDNNLRDSDCDGLSDADEFGTIWVSGKRTDPAQSDSDGDGLPDGFEAGRASSIDPRCSGRFVGDGDPTSRTDPTNPDSDGDGLVDGDEDGDLDGVFDRTSETDPRNPDSDGDGLCDGPNDVMGVCTGNDPDPIPGGQDQDGDGLIDPFDPMPMDPDSDGDGLCDGPTAVSGVCVSGEDLDGDGGLGPGETDPQRIDTDCDGLTDGHNYASFRGERDAMTDPRNPDSDGDGLFDGLELGLTTPADPTCAGFLADGDPATMTDPLKPDTDGDGVPDGAEDSDQDGVVDPGELDPNNPADGATDPTALGACALSALVPVDRRFVFPPDLQLASRNLPPDAFLETNIITSPRGQRGGAGFNAQAQVAYLMLDRTPAGTTALQDEQALLASLRGVGMISAPLASTFTTWDGYPAVRSGYQLAGNGGLKAMLNRIATELEPGAQGLLSVATDLDVMGAFRVEAELVRRSDRRTIVLLAIAPANAAAELTGFTLSDTAGGSALAQYGDAIGLRCDRFETQPFSSLEILWAVDNSQSMADEQAKVGEAAAGMVARLENATVEWRASVVTSGFHDPLLAQNCISSTCGDTTFHQCRAFTNDLLRFSRWFTENDPSWLGAGGPCNRPSEKAARGAELILSAPPAQGLISFLPVQTMADELHLKENANLLIIFLGDADDQFFGNAQLPAGIDTYEAFFRALPVASLKMGGIICPEGQGCGETQQNPRVIRGLINRFGGIIGSLQDLGSIAPTVQAIIDDGLGGASPYPLTRAAIASTIKVVMEAQSTVGMCNWANVPRSRQDGFDYDPRTNRVLFFGACRPNPDTQGRRISVSYRYWIDLTGEPDQPVCTACATCPGITRCDFAGCTCICDQAIDCAAGFAWDSSACDCLCDPTALNCGTTRSPDLALCACVCLPDCGGCPNNTTCQPSLCSCRGTDL